MDLGDIIALPGCPKRTAGLVRVVTAFVVLRAVGEQLEKRALLNLVKQREIETAWESLRTFARRYSDSEPTPEEMVQWAESEEF